MTDFKRIYATQAAAYEQMVAREDYEGNILPALWGIRPFTDQTVIDLGAGTGRLTYLLAPPVHRIIALDISFHMLGVARERLGLADLRRPARFVALAAADNRYLPIASQTADIAIIGWSLGHFVGWYADWQAQIGQALAEMGRVLRPNGTIIILETLGTGRETPQPPHDGLAAYYNWLENKHGFNSTWIRTDYCFASVDEADALTRFFFGNELADRIRRDNLTILPECTGIWWKEVDE
ncbi:MAG: methyltransferase domain-containing protein [Ardenticatenaceae bacterium]|nr:methyltransferase domain-containing protein [Ardenticatenaceae bacterium]MCB9446247.1 methyltransferase domain-containing protein [Ardenticatenaceae bacterium]